MRLLKPIAMPAAVLVLLVGAASATGGGVESDGEASATGGNVVSDAEWNSFKATYGKVYQSDVVESGKRTAYADNKAFVDQHMTEHAEGKHTYTVALNEFADLTTEEFVSVFNGLKTPGTSVHNAHQVTGKTLPKTRDWRNYGAVTGVKNQGYCGSCWAFSTIGALEGAWALTKGHLVSLSEEQLVDCSCPYGNGGCDGGWMDRAFNYIKANGGIDSEDSYPYDLSAPYTCKVVHPYSATLSDYVDISEGDEDALEDAVANFGPVSVAIDASHKSFHLYSSGVYNETKCGSSEDDLDHGVLVVGYGEIHDVKYWIVKNSWTTEWGMDGYIRMTRDGSNQCGIATKASYPLV